MAVTVPTEWQAPSADASEQYRLGWIDESVQQGNAFNQSQRGAKDWRTAFDLLSGVDSSNTAVDYRSRLSGKRLKTNIRTAISGLANIRPIWGFHAGDAFKTYAEALNRTTWALYLEGYWDQDVKEALWWAAGTGGGFMRPVYRRNVQGDGNIFLDVYGTPSVLPVQIPRNGDYNGAYVVTLMDEMPIFEAHWRFPLFQDRLKPTSSRYWHASEIREAAKRNALRKLVDWFRRPTGSDNLTDQYIPIRVTTINDLSLNTTNHRIAMGQPGSSWEYEVPFYGEEISNGAGGVRKADENDIRIYPQRRVIISSEKCIMYDGPGFNWDGELDLTQFTVDKLPWEPTGFSMVHDGGEIQQSLDFIDRASMDKIRAQMDPSLAYPMGGVTKQEAEDFDPFAPRQRVGYDEQSVDQPFKLCVPPDVYKIGDEAFKLRANLQDELDYQIGTRDIVEMAKARALSKNLDSLEALMKSYGPIVQDVARGMEKSLGRIGRQIGWRILQYMPTSRLMQYASMETLAMNVWDYDPASIIPSHLPGENPYAEDGVTKRDSGFTKMQRAKWFAKNIRFFLMPHSVHEATQTTFRLGLLQLRGRGYPVSASTVMEAFEIPNVGKPQGNTEQERFYSEKEEDITKAARMQKIVQEMGMEMGLGGAPQAPNAGGPKKTGRPNSDKAPAHQEVKGDGRPVISTSQ